MVDLVKYQVNALAKTVTPVKEDVWVRVRVKVVVHIKNVTYPMPVFQISLSPSLQLVNH
jgi:hypothetical protein